MRYRTIPLPFPVARPVCALGSHTKNTVSFAAGTRAEISPVHNDLGAFEDAVSFEKDVRRYLRRGARIIAHDMHPDYYSTVFAQSLPPRRYTRIPVQHHHAHIAACMAENGLKGRTVIGVAFDGTGLGDDNTLWGGEFLLCDYARYERVAHLQEIELAGGERAIVEPWRLAAVWLYRLYGDRFLKFNLELTRGMEKKKWDVIKKMIEQRVNTPTASSVGRLFDAAAGLILGTAYARHLALSEGPVRASAQHPAELAIALEKKASEYRGKTAPYEFAITRREGVFIIDPSLIFGQVVADLRRRRPQEEIAYAFHLTVADMIRNICRLMRRSRRINEVVLSGGVFQNTILLRCAEDLLYRDKFTVYTHKLLSPGDASLSLGQAVVASAQGAQMK